MVENISLLADNFNKVKECFLHTQFHAYCVDCLKRKNIDEDPCQLCRPFYALSDNGFGGYSREYLMGKLVDLQFLHQLSLESFLGRNLIIYDKVIDVPVVDEQFILEGVHEEDVLVAWLDDKIYVTYFGIQKVRVFNDQTPFTELPTPIHIEKLNVPQGMVASTLSNSIFVSDSFSIWKIQLPDHEITRSQIWDNSRPEHLSVTPDDELLVVMVNTSLDYTTLNYTRLDILSLKDFSKSKSIIVPFICYKIFCAAQLPNKNIIISHTEDRQSEICLFRMLKTDGKSILTSFSPIQRNPQYPTYFATDNHGKFFVANTIHGSLWVLDSKLLGSHMISNLKLESYDRPRIVCMNGRQQLLVCNKSNDGIVSISMFHLSPCNLIRGGNGKSLLPASDKSRIKRKREASSASNFQELSLKKRK